MVGPASALDPILQGRGSPRNGGVLPHDCKSGGQSVSGLGSGRAIVRCCLGGREPPRASCELERFLGAVVGEIWPLLWSHLPPYKGAIRVGMFYAHAAYYRGREPEIGISYPYYLRYGLLETGVLLPHELCHHAIHLQYPMARAHGREFQAEARRTGAPMYSLPMENAKPLVYVCPNCRRTVARARRQHSAGRWDPRFVFVFHHLRRLDVPDGEGLGRPRRGGTAGDVPRMTARSGPGRPSLHDLTLAVGDALRHVNDPYYLNSCDLLRFVDVSDAEGDDLGRGVRQLSDNPLWIQLQHLKYSPLRGRGVREDGADGG